MRNSLSRIDVFRKDLFFPKLYIDKAGAIYLDLGDGAIIISTKTLSIDSLDFGSKIPYDTFMRMFTDEKLILYSGTLSIKNNFSKDDLKSLKELENEFFNTLI